MLEGTIKWLDANSRKVTKHVRTGESLDLTNPAPLSCANLSFKSHKKTVFFSGLTVQENSLSFSIINAFYIIHVPDGCSFTLELITPGTCLKCIEIFCNFPFKYLFYCLMNSTLSWKVPIVIVVSISFYSATAITCAQYKQNGKMYHDTLQCIQNLKNSL